MKDTIKKILKETVDNKKDKFERYILKNSKERRIQTIIYIS